MKIRWFYILLVFILFIGPLGSILKVDAADRVVELQTKRTDNTRTFRNTDLTETIDVFPYPVFEKDEAGAYQPFDLSENMPGLISYVSEAASSTNFSNDNKISFGTDESGEYRTFIKFGNQLPEMDGKLFLGATLKLYERDNLNQPGYYDPTYKNDKYAIHKVMSSWDVNTLTWDSQPEFSPIPTTNISDYLYVGGPRFTWNITNLVKEWYETPGANHGFVIKSANPLESGTLRNFYKSDNNLNIIPVLQIQYTNPPTGLSAVAYGLGENSQEGYVNFQWHKVSGAKGYRVLIFNGKEFEAIDVGNSTTWSTHGKNIWPTPDQIKEGNYQLRLDGTGTNLSDSPEKVYQNAGGTSKNPRLYYFKIQAYNDFGSVESEEFAARVPDQTAPSLPTNVRVVNELHSNFTITWDESSDEGSGIGSYEILVKSGSGWIYNTFTTTNQVVIPEDRLFLRTPYYISVRARDNHYSSGGNYSAYSEQIQSQARLERDSLFTSYAIPTWAISIDYNPYIRIIVRNEGAEDWSNENGYELKAEGMQIVQPFKDGEVIKPGEEKTFEFYLTGEKPLGETKVKFRMYNYHTGYFGDYIDRTLTFADLTKPDAIIDSPGQYDSITGEVQIKGSIKDYQLKEYKISFGAGNTPVTWTEISGTGYGDILGVWNTKGLASGLYTIRLQAEDESGNSTIVERKVFVNIPPSPPNVYSVGDNTSMVSGIAQAGSTIIVTKAGVQIGSGIVDNKGSFSVSIPKQVAGTLLNVTASDQANNTSAPTIVTVIDKTAPIAPTVNTISNNSTTVTGTAEAAATVRVYRGSTLLGSSAVTSNRTYSMTIAKQVAGSILTVKVTDKAGNVSPGKNITVIDKIAPSIPTISTVADNTKTVSGTAEKYATIRVKRGTTVIGTAKVNSYGKYSLTIPLQKTGTVLYFTATDIAGNTSTALKKTVIDKTAPGIPSVNTVYSWHKYVKGKAEPYSYITIKKGSTAIGKAQANSKGYYTAYIKAQRRGSLLAITAKDKAGNVSRARTIYVK